MSDVSARLNALHWARLKAFLERSGQRKYWRQRVAELEAEFAQAIEARSDETRSGSAVGESAVRQDAPNPGPLTNQDGGEKL